MSYNIVLKRLDNQLPNFLTLNEIKAYLRVDSKEDDAILTSLAIAACEKAENFMSVNLLERSVKQVVFDVFGSKIKLHQHPVIKVENVLDENNEVLPNGTWVFNNNSNNIEFSSEKRSSTMSINYISGFTRSNVSQAIKIGLLEHISSLYDGQSIDQGIPASSVDLYSTFRNRRIWRSA